jgi:exopolyphosphatase/guanosine-5'-triphosphate,3'-diphosphate pyrophosphatase
VDLALEVYEAERIQGHILTRKGVERIMFSLAVKNNEERKSVLGLQPERADIIVAGTTILWSILTYLNAPGVRVSDADLLYGIIQEMI